MREVTKRGWDAEGSQSRARLFFGGGGGVINIVHADDDGMAEREMDNKLRVRPEQQTL